MQLNPDGSMALEASRKDIAKDVKLSAKVRPRHTKAYVCHTAQGAAATWLGLIGSHWLHA